MWPEISLLHYDPRNPGSSRRIKPEVWQRFHEKITTLHNEGCTKAEIRTNIENDPEAILLSFHPRYELLFYGSSVGIGVDLT